MFNPHIHQQQQQQQQQFHQHLRQLQQLFHQQPPPPPPQPPPGHHVPHHHHQAPRAISVPPQTAPPSRMVNMCQTTQTTIIAPNPMLQGAILMQHMQGNMRGFAMAGQQFRQFFAAGTRSSLLGPVPMGVAMKSPMMGFPAVRTFHPHARYYNNVPTTSSASSSSSYSYSSASTTITTTTTTDTVVHQPDRKRDNEQIATGSTDGQPAASSTSETNDSAMQGAEGPPQPSEEQLEEPVVKKQKTAEGSEEPKEQSVVETATIMETDAEVFSSQCNSNTEDSQPDDCIILEEDGSIAGSVAVEAMEESQAAEVQSELFAPSPSGRLSEESLQDNLLQEETPQDKDVPLASPDNHEEGEEGAAEGTSKFYCYLCSITCHNQQNFKSHMNSVSHQQRMMEIQHMSNACLVTLLPRIQESLQAVQKDEEKDIDMRRWCATCQTHFTNTIMDHCRTEEHKFANRMTVSSCTICKKRFKTSRLFVEHLQSQEHRQAWEKLEEKEGGDTLAKLSDMDTEGCSVEEEEGSNLDEEESQTNHGDQENSNKQDDWSPQTEVTLKDMASDEQHDPDKVYGSSFLIPVAGFLCRLCNKFYHFESSTLHSHCKSLKHFENLKSYRVLLHQKSEAAGSSRESLLAEDKLRPVTETTIDCSDGNSNHNISGSNSLSGDTGLITSPNSMQPVVAVAQLETQTDTKQQEEQAQPNSPSQDLISTSATSIDCTKENLNLHKEEEEEEETTAQASVAQEPDSEPAAAVQVANEEEEKEAPVLSGKKSSKEKAKATPKRRSGRASRR
ncbi:hypothetical protein LDENG_00031810 [Lucifuga dentata]|nr:hypothetical protein LDENG_00031810 [Lucifuga dentata]